MQAEAARVVKEEKEKSENTAVRTLRLPKHLQDSARVDAILYAQVAQHSQSPTEKSQENVATSEENENTDNNEQSSTSIAQEQIEEIEEEQENLAYEGGDYESHFDEDCEAYDYYNEVRFVFVSLF